MEKSDERQVQCKERISHLKLLCENSQGKVWQLNEKTMIKSNRCSDGFCVEAKHKYNEAVINQEQVKLFENNLMHLRDVLVNDSCSNYYQSQMAQLEIERLISDILDETNENVKRTKLKRALTALFALQRKPKSHDDPFLELTRNWLTNLVT